MLILFGCKEDTSAAGAEQQEAWGLDKGDNQAICYVNELENGDIIFSEVMLDNENVYDFRGEWIEVYNTTDQAVDLLGLRIERMLDNQEYMNDGHFEVMESLVVQPGETVIFAHRYFPHVNGGLPRVDYLYNYLEMKLTNIETLRMTGGGSVLDSVTWDKSWPHKVGRSLTLDADEFTVGGNDDVKNWCYGVQTYGEYGEYGTPGAANSQCLNKNDLTVGDLVITEIMHNPNKVDDWAGEWFEVLNTTQSIIDIIRTSVSVRK